VTHSATGDVSDRRHAALAVPSILEAFDAYQAAFKVITQRAKSRFERREWHGAVADATERLDLYGLVVDRLESDVRATLGPQVADRTAWVNMKAAYLRLIGARPDSELAETFFNSVTRRIFATVGVDRNIEFTESGFESPTAETHMLPLRTYEQPSDLSGLIEAVLHDCRLECEFEDLHRDSDLVAARLSARLRGAGASDRINRAAIIPAPFFRRKGAYVLGWLDSGAVRIPLALALLNKDRGIVVDALLTDEDDISILFSFARSHFNVDLGPPSQLIQGLKVLMPKKPIAELYIALGHHKHGKTELYRDLIRHLGTSEERFVFAPGAHGMVMVVFTLPGFDVVFKVIKDHFPAVKPMTPSDVRNTYRLVFRSERAGRLVEAQEFEHLEFERARFAPEIIEQFQREADETVEVTADQVIIHHAYIERRVTPLDVYLREVPEQAARDAVDDYGQAIKDLAANGIFPGELLPKNFGVTRHFRVVCYDYDELSFLTDFTFRAIPPSRFDEDDYADESWFGVGPRDVFPKEIRRFIGLPADLLLVLDQSHSELYEVDFWREMQARVTQGEIFDIFPYQSSRRLQQT
jgi:isocitrate dehydrogenase kinase/phosphatase